MKIFVIRTVLAMVILAMAVFIGQRVMSHMQTKDYEVTSVALEDQQGANAWIHGFSYRQTKAGGTKWMVTADQAKIFEKEQLARLEDVQVKLFDGDFHREQLYITSEEGMMNTSTNNFDLVSQKQQTVMTFESGYQVFSDRLTWVEEARELQTSDPVVIRGNGLTITGVGLKGNVDSKEFQLLAHVRAEVSSP
jgi:LPS export ABC transporter protein LptC